MTAAARPGPARRRWRGPGGGAGPAGAPGRAGGAAGAAAPAGRPAAAGGAGGGLAAGRPPARLGCCWRGCGGPGADGPALYESQRKRVPAAARREGGGGPAPGVRSPGAAGAGSCAAERGRARGVTGT